jgi:hypothetical protein
LDLLAEQRAIPMDQLCEFLGEPMDVVEHLVGCFLRAGLVRRARPVPSEPAWVWLTLRGVARSSHELSEPRPRVGGLAMSRAVNEVRLSIAARADVRWVSGNLERRRRGRRGGVPRAVIEAAGERHAIDVWLGNPDRSVMSRRLRSRAGEYDFLVWYYAREACASVEQFAVTCGCADLVVRPLPGLDLRGLLPVKWRVDCGADGPESWSAPGIRRPRRLTADDQLWKRLRAGSPVRMSRVVPESVPDAAFEVVAEVSGRDRVGLCGDVWRREGRGTWIFRLETDAGTYRVIRSRWGWRATEVRDESVFELVAGPPRVPRPPQGPPRSRYVEAVPAHYEFGEEVWAKVRPLIPPIEQRPRAHRGRRALSDRAMLSALVFLARRRRGFWSLRREQGYGSGLTVKRRLEYWLEIGVWDPVCEVLAESLPDGRDLDWRWWAAYSRIVSTS